MVLRRLLIEILICGRNRRGSCIDRICGVGWVPRVQPLGGTTNGHRLLLLRGSNIAGWGHGGHAHAGGWGKPRRSTYRWPIPTSCGEWRLGSIGHGWPGWRHGPMGVAHGWGRSTNWRLRWAHSGRKLGSVGHCWSWRHRPKTPTCRRWTNSHGWAHGRTHGRTCWDLRTIGHGWRCYGSGWTRGSGSKC